MSREHEFYNQQGLSLKIGVVNETKMPFSRLEKELRRLFGEVKGSFANFDDILDFYLTAKGADLPCYYYAEAEVIINMLETYDVIIVAAKPSVFPEHSVGSAFVAIKTALVNRAEGLAQVATIKRQEFFDLDDEDDLAVLRFR